MIEIVVYMVLAFGGGYFAGHEHPTVTVECRDIPLIQTNCVDIVPPADSTFGETTRSYIGLVTTYQKCKAACEIK